MARIRDRIIALVLAGVFFVTSFALSFLVIWQIYQDKKEAKPVDQSITGDNKPVLKGTQLANFTPVAQVDSLQKIDTKEGTGKEVKASDTITFDYTGAVAATGVIFESSADSGRPATFPLSKLIKGWQEGIPGMKEGGTRRLLIPADQAYGASPPAGSIIPPNAPLVFDLTIHKVGE